MEIQDELQCFLKRKIARFAPHIAFATVCLFIFLMRAHKNRPQPTQTNIRHMQTCGAFGGGRVGLLALFVVRLHSTHYLSYRLPLDLLRTRAHRHTLAGSQKTSHRAIISRTLAQLVLPAAKQTQTSHSSSSVLVYRPNHSGAFRSTSICALIIGSQYHCVRVSFVACLCVHYSVVYLCVLWNFFRFIKLNCIHLKR